jgi:hypothetical protein
MAVCVKIDEPAARLGAYARWALRLDSSKFPSFRTLNYAGRLWYPISMWRQPCRPPSLDQQKGHNPYGNRSQYTSADDAKGTG